MGPCWAELLRWRAKGGGVVGKKWKEVEGEVRRLELDRIL